MRGHRSKILIDSNPFEKRVAILEGGKLVEYFNERPGDRGLSGNIYKGKVVRVLPGMQAAFVDVGLDRTAFLHVSDIKENLKGIEEEEENGAKEEKSSKKDGAPPRIEKLIKEGQDIMVQVEKEPIGTKGARVTSYASLPGRYLVLMPTYGRIGVSRRIGDDKERRRLRSIVRELRPPGYGFIIRTVCKGMRREDIKADMEYLLKLWEGIELKRKKLPIRSILYEEPDLTLKVIRDIFSRDVQSLIISPRDEYERVKTFTREFMPRLSQKVRSHSDERSDVLEAHGVDIELDRALEKKVWLRSGGHLVMDQMEALTAIDVNTGKYVGKKNSEDTILKTNLESVKEVVHQLRLRNIGGIIIIDFIDMLSHENREKVYHTLKHALKSDKARTNILKISELGVIEMTRKRTRESLVQSYCTVCPYCDGNGFIKSDATLITDIYRQLVVELTKKKRKIVIYAHPTIVEALRSTGGVLAKIYEKFGKRVVTKSAALFHREEYEIL